MRIKVDCVPILVSDNRGTLYDAQYKCVIVEAYIPNVKPAILVHDI